MVSPVALLLLLALSPMPISADEPPSTCDSLEGLRWLLGEWSAADGSSGETWTLASPATFEGVGRAGSSEESLRLVAMSDEVFYLAKVGHNPMPTPFRATVCATDRAVFTNPDHDFPKQLDYRLDGDTLTVTVSDGADRGFQLRWTRRGS